jgi:homoserine O-succinyltransferase/O-acetyltransferase
VSRRLRIGIINLMPKVEHYEPLLRRVLAPAARAARVHLDLAWIALSTHAYASSDAAHLSRAYVSFAEAQRAGLDGLILTGAPVEELAFEEVRYWPELRALLQSARAQVPSTLGICWGGMALSYLLGIEKVRYAKKLFGVYPMRVLGVAGEGAEVVCAHSRHAGVDGRGLEQAARAGVVVPRMHSSEVGHAVFESGDGRFSMHLGHPEYDADRLMFEYARDRALGRDDVAAPHGLDLSAPLAQFCSHGPQFFAHWLGRLASP